MVKKMITPLYYYITYTHICVVFSKTQLRLIIFMIMFEIGIPCKQIKLIPSTRQLDVLS